MKPFKLTYQVEIAGFKFVIEHLHREGIDLFRRYRVREGLPELDQILLNSQGVVKYFDGRAIKVTRDKSKLPEIGFFYRSSPILGVDWYLRCSKELNRVSAEFQKKKGVKEFGLPCRVELGSHGSPEVIWAGPRKMVEFGEYKEFFPGLMIPSSLSADLSSKVDFTKSHALNKLQDTMFIIPPGLARELWDLDAGTKIRLR